MILTCAPYKNKKIGKATYFHVITYFSFLETAKQKERIPCKWTTAFSHLFVFAGKI